MQLQAAKVKQGNLVKVSFLITYFNQEKFVDKSISSVINQVCGFEYEILIGDDGSSDSTLDRIKYWQEQYPDKIKYFIQPRESEKKYNLIWRASANRLNLLKHAKGDYFCFLDGDDYYNNNNFAQKSVEILEKNKKITGCCFNFEYEYPDKKCLFKNDCLNDGEIDAKKYINYSYVPSSAILFRNCIKESDFKKIEKYKIFDDNTITIFMLKFGNFYNINENVFTYVQRKDSIWNKSNDFEKSFLIMMDSEIACKLAPKFKFNIYQRNIAHFSVLFENRNNLINLLGKEKFENYSKEAKELKNRLVFSLLNWQNQNIFIKFKLIFFYKMMKYLRAKNIKKDFNKKKELM